MSLVGNLEDLSLGDILQIISLSQKSGVLALSGDEGTGRIVFRSGLVQAACLKGGPNALRDLLVHHACIDPAGFDAVESRAADRGLPIEELLESEAGLSQVRIHELITNSAESAILEMFCWPSGDFSFDVRNELDPEDPQLTLAKGINAQYLAMEGLRIRDERERDHGGDEADPNADTDPNIGVAEDPLFGTDSLEEEAGDGEDLDSVSPFLDFDLDGEDTAPVVTVVGELSGDAPAIPAAAEELPTATDTLVARVVENADAADDLTIDEIDVAMPLDFLPEASFESEIESPREVIEESDLLAPERPALADAPQHSPSAPVVAESAPVDSARVADARKMPVVLIDPDVTVLEWVKAAIEHDFARVHVFQQADQGLSRIRQYLIRGETPLVLLSPDVQIDPLSGIHGLSDFVKRLKSQSQRLIVLGLRDDEDEAPTAMPGALNGVLRRPAKRLLADNASEEGAMASQVLARALLEILAQPDQVASGRKNTSTGTGSMRSLRDTTAKLQDASSRGEILPVVLDFASEMFSRVAILIVREDEVFAIAGRGISTLEVDPLDSAPPVTVPTPEAGWIRTVLDSGKAIVAAPGDEADHVLLERFGGENPKQVYLGPIESGSAVIALLYGDQSSSGAPMPDTHGLEVVLHHAGLALDRAALERALWEADADAS